MHIAVRHLTHTYTGQGIQERTVLDIPDWQVEVGSHVLLRGISGSGKTTLLNILAGLLPPTKGMVWLGDQPLFDLPEARRDRFRARHVGYVFQMHHLVSTLTALENVEMPLVFAGGMTAAQRRQQAGDLLAQMGLADFFHHRPVQLSTGQRLRVAVARALVGRPSLVLADEPTAALDTAASGIVMGLLQDRCRVHNATLIVASHDPLLNDRCDTVIDLTAGRMIPQPVAE